MIFSSEFTKSKKIAAIVADVSRSDGALWGLL
jgi:hypothetical protein